MHKTVKLLLFQIPHNFQKIYIFKNIVKKCIFEIRTNRKYKINCYKNRFQEILFNSFISSGGFRPNEALTFSKSERLVGTRATLTIPVLKNSFPIEIVDLGPQNGPF